MLTPTYHVFEMNKGHQDATSLAVHLRARDARRRVTGDTELDTLSASASRKDGTVLVSLSNMSLDTDTSVRLDLRGQQVGAARARILTADKPQSHNTVSAPDAVAPAELAVTVTPGTFGSTELVVELPPHSFATVEVELL